MTCMVMISPASTGVTCGNDKKDNKENDVLSDKETDYEQQQQEQDETSFNPLAQHGPLTEQESCTVDEGETKECDGVKEEHNDGDSLGGHHHWKQEERMVLEAGSKAAEIAKTAFGMFMLNFSKNIICIHLHVNLRNCLNLSHTQMLILQDNNIKAKM